MSQLVAMSKTGNLCVLTPLYALREGEEMNAMPGHILALLESQPLAYVLDAEGICQVLSARFLEKQVEILGAL